MNKSAVFWFEFFSKRFVPGPSSVESKSLCNSTDEGSGPKRLEKNLNQNTALLFIIFLFLLLNIPILTF